MIKNELMKRKLVSILIPATLIFAVGCSSNEIKHDDTIENITENNQKTRNNEEMYAIYESHIDEIKLLSEKYGISLKDDSHEQTNYKNKLTALYAGDENVDENDIEEITYVANIDKLSNISKITASIDMRVKDDNFKLEESKFNELRNIFTDEEIDYTEINERISECIKTGTLDNIVNNYDDIEEDILISGDTISYRLRIYP